LRGGPSAPLGRTVRSPWADRPPFTSCNPPEAKSSLVIFSTDRRTVHTPGADHPPFTLKTHQRPNTSLVNLLSDLRTVHSPTFQPKLEKQLLWTISLKHPRTVRTPGADRPQYGLQAQTELHSLWTKIESYWRTVRPTGLDCLPVTSFSHKLININSNTFSFANVPTPPPQEQHHVHVC